MQEKLPDCVCYLYICLKRRILEINSKKKNIETLRKNFENI